MGNLCQYKKQGAVQVDQRGLRILMITDIGSHNFTKPADSNNTLVNWHKTTAWKPNFRSWCCDCLYQAFFLYHMEAHRHGFKKKKYFQKPVKIYKKKNNKIIKENLGFPCTQISSLLAGFYWRDEPHMEQHACLRLELVQHNSSHCTTVLHSKVNTIHRLPRSPLNCKQ